VTRHVDGLTETYTLRRDLAEGERLTTWILGLCAKYSLPDKVAFALQLCLDETVANIIEHSKERGREATEISVNIAREEKRIVMTVVDDGDEFDPTQFETQQARPSRDEPVVGGVGIRLMRKFATGLKYERLDQRNHLHFMFTLAE
jgi:anti-sigma regulatory factor (Ser/Thr protein kinase)